MGPKCLKVATRNKLDPNRRISAPCPKDLIRSPLPMASSSPSIGWQMKTDSKPPVTISQPHHPCRNTSSRCSQTSKRLEFCKQYSNKILLIPSTGCTITIQNRLSNPSFSNIFWPILTSRYANTTNLKNKKRLLCKFLHDR